MYNVAWGNRISVNDLARMIGELMGKRLAPKYEAARPGDVRDSQADSTRAQMHLGWRPVVTFEDGLKRTIAWFLS